MQKVGATHPTAQSHQHEIAHSLSAIFYELCDGAAANNQRIHMTMSPIVLLFHRLHARLVLTMHEDVHRSRDTCAQGKYLFPLATYCIKFPLHILV